MRRLLRLAWLTAAVAVAAAAGIAVAAGNAPSAPAANPTFSLVQVTKTDCPAPKVILGKGCWDRSGQVLSANWSVNDGNATWDTTGWTTTYKWTVPATIGPTGAAIKLNLTALSKSGVVCPAMGAHPSFPLKDPKQDPVLGVCGKPNEGTATASKTVNIVATSSGPGAITIGLQDGPQITYKYIAKPTPVCRKFSSSAANPEPPFIVTFAVAHRGVPPRGESPTLSQSVSGAEGKLSICDKLEARGALASDATGTVHHNDEHALGQLHRIEKLVLTVKRGAYNKTANWEKVALVVVVTKSDDRDCRVGAEGRLTLTEDAKGQGDEFWLRLCGSNHTHRVTGSGKVQVNVLIHTHR
jgi:hypothetical protein